MNLAKKLLHALSVILFFGFVVAPSFVWAFPQGYLSDLQGKPASSSSDKNLELVVFWATWCPDCKEKLGATLPKLNASPDISVVTVSTEKEVARTEHFIEKEKVSLPVYLDDEKRLRKELKIFSVPAWAVYKRDTKAADWKLVDSASAFENDRINKALGRQAL